MVAVVALEIMPHSNVARARYDTDSSERGQNMLRRRRDDLVCWRYYRYFAALDPSGAVAKSRI